MRRGGRGIEMYGGFGRLEERGESRIKGEKGGGICCIKNGGRVKYGDGVGG